VDSFVQLRSPEAKTEAGSSAALRNDKQGQRNEAANGATSVEVIGPDGKRPLSLAEEATAQSVQLTQAGFYQIRFASGKDALIAVNADPRESGLELIPDDVLKLWSGSPGGESAAGTTAATAETTKNAYGLWWWVMLLILAAVLAECLVASQYLGTQREEA
jgi:hypothetical protein